ncbi:hypothetical protein [Allosphingosinicella vermicomposti]|uniref:hypothetical protein n=1 Tax=Allosphingosinicella vermicomposti TaxID=614671 RepID=UPI00131A4C78|nr:hypothetical protein [Allosphingosinicella vermicomposti]
MDDQISELRGRADQCRSQARATQHRPTAAMLEQMAIEYEMSADKLETRYVEGSAQAGS